MKKYFFVGIAFMAFAFSAQSQNISKHALGLRLGDSDGFGTEISYQLGLSENNRLELDLGWRSGSGFDAYRITGLYQWVWVLDGNFNWYAGAGGGVAQVDFDTPFLGDDSETYFYAAGNAGIEYNFDIPLILSLDVRPEFGFGDFNDDFDFDLGLGIRYQF